MDSIPCPRCRGLGHIWTGYTEDDGPFYEHTIPCPRCNGTGYVEERTE